VITYIAHYFSRQSSSNYPWIGQYFRIGLIHRPHPAGSVLASTGVSSLDNLLGGDGYPDRSAVLIVGPPGIGKEALGYWFIHSGLVQNDFCLYTTRLSTREVLQDVKAFNVDFSQRVPFWFASDGTGQLKLNINDLSGLSYSIKEIMKKNSGRRTRIVTDILSSLLMLNPPDMIYKFLTQLFEDIKQYDTTLLATLEEGMHATNVLTAMQQLFDGVIELKLYEEGLRVIPLVRIRKMRGVAPQPGYYNFSFTKTGMVISPHV
jgi:circadian clock protein KaiC